MKRNRQYKMRMRESKAHLMLFTLIHNLKQENLDLYKDGCWE